MANSIITTVGDGATTQFALNFTLGILKRRYVTCRVGDEVDGLGDPVYRDLEWVTDGLVNIQGDVPADGETIVFTRTIPKDTLIHDYADGVPIVEENLDESNLQAIMAIHEFIDGRLGTIEQNFDMSGNKVVNLGAATNAGDAVRYDQISGIVDGIATVDASVVLAEAAVEAAETAAAEAEASAASLNFDLADDNVFTGTNAFQNPVIVGEHNLTTPLANFHIAENAVYKDILFGSGTFGSYTGSWAGFNAYHVSGGTWDTRDPAYDGAFIGVQQSVNDTTSLLTIGFVDQAAGAVTTPAVFTKDGNLTLTGTINASALPAATTTVAGAVEQATSGEMTAGTANKFPDCAAVKTYVDANSSGGTDFDTLVSPGSYAIDTIYQWTGAPGFLICIVSNAQSTSIQTRYRGKIGPSATPSYISDSAYFYGHPSNNYSAGEAIAIWLPIKTNDYFEIEKTDNGAAATESVAWLFRPFV